MEGDTVTLQDAFTFDHAAGTDQDGRLLGRAMPTGVRPRFLDRFVEQGVSLPTRALGGVPHLVPVGGRQR
jgi:pilus assembly protein CpaF